MARRCASPERRKFGEWGDGRFPDRFSLRNHPEYPDASDQHKRLYGPLKQAGYVAAVEGARRSGSRTGVWRRPGSSTRRWRMAPDGRTARSTRYLGTCRRSTHGRVENCRSDATSRPGAVSDHALASDAVIDAVGEYAAATRRHPVREPLLAPCTACGATGVLQVLPQASQQPRSEAARRRGPMPRTRAQPSTTTSRNVQSARTGDVRWRSAVRDRRSRRSSTPSIRILDAAERPAQRAARSPLPARAPSIAGPCSTRSTCVSVGRHRTRRGTNSATTRWIGVSRGVARLEVVPRSTGRDSAHARLALIGADVCPGIGGSGSNWSMRSSSLGVCRAGL